MLYLLRGLENDTTFYLIKKMLFSLGRKDCDFVIQNDQSISRNHAEIKIHGGQVTVKDCGSKYKTVYNGSELEPNVEVHLEVNTQIKFGVFNSVYRLETQEITTTGTHLNATDKKKLKNVLNIIGGNYVDNWGPECTHLTVKEMSVTVKVLHALLDEKPIVVSEYWTEFSEKVLKNQPPPDIESFNKPPVGEPLLRNVNFTKQVSRKYLFKDKMFIFPAEKNKILLEDVIKKAGGICKSWDKNPSPLSQLFSLSKQILVIRVSNQEESSTFSDLIKEVVKRGKRAIPLHEIALSVITGSCEKDCNPDFDRAGAVFSKAIPILPTQTGILAQNTQSEYISFSEVGENKTSKVVADTFDQLIELILPVKEETETFKPSSSSEVPHAPITSKRKNNEQMDTGKQKKPKVEIPIAVPSTSKEIPTQKKEPESTETSSNSSSSQKTDNNKHSKEEESDKTSGTKKRVNPFANLLKGKTEPKNSSPPRSKRFKTEITGSRSETSRRNVFNALTNTITANSSNSSIETSLSNVSNIFSSTKINIEAEPVNITRQSSKEYFSSIPWHSKSTTIREEECECLDPELRNFSKLFKGSVVIEFVESTSFRQLPRFQNEDTVDNAGSPSKKNFKRFKKVMPRRPQRTILNHNHSVEVSSVGVPVNDRRAFADTDDEDSPNRNNNIKMRFAR